MKYIDENEKSTPRCHTLLVLGNGFDLNLGLKTSYKDFYYSDFWPYKAEDTIYREGTEKGFKIFLSENHVFAA